MTSAQNIRSAIVTGSSRGIGAAIATRLAADGFAVIVNYTSNEKAAAETVKKIQAAGGNAVAVKADVARPAEAALLFDKAEALFGGTDILVNNAAIMHDYKPLPEMDDETFDRTIAVNFKGTFNTLRLAASRLREGGRVINFSSSLTKRLAPNYSIYAATKAAVEAMTNIYAKELRGRNITANVVAPGPTATEMFLTGKTAEQVDFMAKMSPFERLGEPDDIANVVSFLAGPEAGWVNGQTIFVNGGLV